MAITNGCGLKLMLLSAIFFIPGAAIIIYLRSHNPSYDGHLLTSAYLLIGAGALQFVTAFCLYVLVITDSRIFPRDRRRNITEHTAGVAASHRSVASTPHRRNYDPPSVASTPHRRNYEPPSVASTPHRRNYEPPQSYEQATRPPNRPAVTGRDPVAPPLVPHMDHSPRVPRGRSPVLPSAPSLNTATEDTCEAPPPSYEEAMRTMV